MKKTWANSGLDLHLDVPATRVRAGLEAALREAVRDGRLHPGIRLPPSRVLAADLGIARNSVAEAYGQLAAEGWLTARTGSGTWVTAHPARPRRAPVAVSPEIAQPRYDLRAGCLTWEPSRSGPGWRRPAPRSVPPPATPWATRTRAACRSCAQRWRTTWPGRAASASPATASWSAPVSRTGLPCSASCSARAVPRPSPWRVMATTLTGGRPRRTACACWRCRSTGTAPCPMTWGRRPPPAAPAHQFPLGARWRRAGAAGSSAGPPPAAGW